MKPSTSSLRYTSSVSLCRLLDHSKIKEGLKKRATSSMIEEFMTDRLITNMTINSKDRQGKTINLKSSIRTSVYTNLKLFRKAAGLQVRQSQLRVLL